MLWLRFSILIITLTLSACHSKDNLDARFIGVPGKIRPLVLDCALSKAGDGSPMLYFCTYNRGNSQGCTFMGVGALSGKVVLQREISGRIGPYHTTSGTDGRIYASIYGSGHAELLSYDPETDLLRVLDIGHESETFSFGLTTLDDGSVLVGTYGGGKLIRFDPRTERFQDLGAIVPGNKYPKAFLSLSRDSLLIGSGAPAHLSLLNPITMKSRTDVLPDQYSDASFVYNLWHTSTKIWCRLAPSGRILALNPSSFEVVASFDSLALSAPIELADGTILFRHSDGRMRQIDPISLESQPGPVVAPSAYGTSIHRVMIDEGPVWVSVNTDGIWWRWRHHDQDFRSTILPIPESATRITSMASGPDGKLYVGTYETNSLYRYDDSESIWESLGVIAPGRTGEILAMHTLDKHLYTLSYINAVLCRYNPDLKWQPGRISGSNPLEIGPLGHEQNRPWDMIVGPDSALYMVTYAGYGLRSGALARYDPVNDSLRVWRGLNGEGNLFSLAIGPDSLLFIGTSQALEGGDPLEGHGQILAFHLGTQSLSGWRVSIPGSKTIQALEFQPSSAGGNIGDLYAIADGGCYVIRFPETEARPLELPIMRALCSANGNVFAGGPSGIFLVKGHSKMEQVCNIGPDFSSSFAAWFPAGLQLSFARQDSAFTTPDLEKVLAHAQ